MAMSSKDYIAVAQAIRKCRIEEKDAATDRQMGSDYFLCLEAGQCSIISSVADVFEDSNPRFDRERFLTACQIDPAEEGQIEPV